MKVLRVRVKGTASDVPGDEYTVGSQVYRFIGDDEVDCCEEDIMKDWEHFINENASPYMLYFKFERMDIGKELNLDISREFINEYPQNAREKVIEYIVKAINEAPT